MKSAPPGACCRKLPFARECQSVDTCSVSRRPKNYTNQRKIYVPRSDAIAPIDDLLLGVTEVHPSRRIGERFRIDARGSVLRREKARVGPKLERSLRSTQAAGVQGLRIASAFAICEETKNAQRWLHQNENARAWPPDQGSASAKAGRLACGHRYPATLLGELPLTSHFSTSFRDQTSRRSAAAPISPTVRENRYCLHVEF